MNKLEDDYFKTLITLMFFSGEVNRLKFELSEIMEKIKEEKTNRFMEMLKSWKKRASI